MKTQPRRNAVRSILILSAAAMLTACGSSKVADIEPLADATNETAREIEVVVTENPNKHLPMDFAVASESTRENRTFPGAFKIAADAIEVGRETSGSIPNIGAQGEAYLEMPHPEDGTQLHIRGNRIRSHSGTVTVTGWPVVVRQGKRLVGTTQDTVIKIGTSGVQALGPSIVEDLVSSSFADSDSVTPLPSLSPDEPFIPLPPDTIDLQIKPDAPVIASEKPQKRGIIDGKPVGRTPKRGFTGTYEGTDNPKLPNDPSRKADIDLTPGTVSSDLGLGNLPPIPSVPNR